MAKPKKDFCYFDQYHPQCILSPKNRENEETLKPSFDGDIVLKEDIVESENSFVASDQPLNIEKTQNPDLIYSICVISTALFFLLLFARILIKMAKKIKKKDFQMLIKMEDDQIVYGLKSQIDNLNKMKESQNRQNYLYSKKKILKTMDILGEKKLFRKLLATNKKLTKLKKNVFSKRLILEINFEEIAQIKEKISKIAMKFAKLQKSEISKFLFVFKEEHKLIANHILAINLIFKMIVAINNPLNEINSKLLAKSVSEFGKFCKKDLLSKNELFVLNQAITINKNCHQILKFGQNTNWKFDQNGELDQNVSVESQSCLLKSDFEINKIRNESQNLMRQLNNSKFAIDNGKDFSNEEFDHFEENADIMQKEKKVTNWKIHKNKINSNLLINAMKIMANREIELLKLREMQIQRRETILMKMKQHEEKMLNFRKMEKLALANLKRNLKNDRFFKQKHENETKLVLEERNKNLKEIEMSFLKKSLCFQMGIHCCSVLKIFLTNFVFGTCRIFKICPFYPFL
ncbi:hypothetical protein MHBO_001475 [Bonamia ostreae]|uniref:Transmembrane protein n=1 Tax=Bonamia ostreae TaxID=126728 RepID=A0ABV2AJ26_9EUKA